MKQMEILSDIRTLLHKKEEHLKRQNEKFLYETGVSSMSLSELHVIECIGKNGLMNVTAITTEMGMTKEQSLKFVQSCFKSNLLRRCKC